MKGRVTLASKFLSLNATQMSLGIKCKFKSRNLKALA